MPQAVDSYGFLWIPKDSYGFLWIHMDSYGFLWIPMDSCGFLWIPMDSYGSYGFLRDSNRIPIESFQLVHPYTSEDSVQVNR